MDFRIELIFYSGKITSMENLDAEIADLKQHIRSAFGNTRYPGDAELLHPECHDDFDIQKFYGQKDWKNVDDAIIEYENAALCFFSPAAYQFFLPRFLVYVLENYRSGYISVDNTIYSLAPSGDQTLHEYQMSKYSLLTREQIECIKAFLGVCAEYLSDYLDSDAVNEALNYWKIK